MGAIVSALFAAAMFVRHTTSGRESSVSRLILGCGSSGPCARSCGTPPTTRRSPATGSGYPAGRLMIGPLAFHLGLSALLFRIEAATAAAAGPHGGGRIGRARLHDAVVSSPCDCEQLGIPLSARARLLLSDDLPALPERSGSTSGIGVLESRYGLPAIGAWSPSRKDLSRGWESPAVEGPLPS